MTDEFELREIERQRDLPPDEPYADRDEDERPALCSHPRTRVLVVYQERRLLCAECGTYLGEADAE